METLREARPELIDSALEVLDGQQRTLRNQALARSFVDAYLDAVAGDHPAQLAVWVEAKAAAILRYGPATSFFNEATRALVEFVEEKQYGDFAAAPLRALRPSGPHSNGAFAPREVVADVDGAINELVSRISGDEYAGDHARNVSDWAKRIARQLGLSAEDVAFVGRAGLVHDIGELQLPAGIVSASRPLHEGEIGLVRTHVLAGEALALEDPLLAPFAPAIRSHHERFDGGGYPDRLRGDAIPLAARIVAVADAFNAMVGRRPHRAPITAPDALDRLRLGARTQFDPRVVGALEAILISR
jgi:hypothetical protein